MKELLNLLNIKKGIVLKLVLCKYNSYSKRNEISLMKDSTLNEIDLNISDLKEIWLRLGSAFASFELWNGGSSFR